MTRLTCLLVLAGLAGQPDALPADEPDPTALKLAVQANSDFAIDLYQQLAKENQGKNLFFSPYSVSGALAMTLEGARGETAVEMGKVLRLPEGLRRPEDNAQANPWETPILHKGLASLNDQLMGEKDQAEAKAVRARIAELREKLDAVKKRVAELQKPPFPQDRQEQRQRFQEITNAGRQEKELVQQLNKELAKVDRYEIRVANALWGEKTYPFKKEYVDTISKYYKSGGMFPVDFRNAFEEARLKINGWVEEQTNNRIKDLIPQGAVDSATSLVLTNAIYFKGEWSVPFKENDTQNRDFTLADGKKVTAPIMFHTLDVAGYGAFNADGSFFNTPTRKQLGQDDKDFYPKSDGFAMVELPYKGDTLSMVVIAPNDPKRLGELEKRLTSANLNKWVGQLRKRKTAVYLPRFKLETSYTLGDAEKPGTLQKMGMVRAFKDPRDPQTGAQFQGMSLSTDPMEQLYISKVLHKAFVEVNEKGTEAAAATAVIMAVPTAAPVSVAFIPEFKADRPFIFLIRDRATGSILFLGRMTQPSA